MTPDAAAPLAVSRGTESLAARGAEADVRVGERQRVYQLDAIRGLLAIGVMVYHAVFWANGTYLPLLGTWGVYGFFVLSGWALEHVYGGRLRVGAFAVARVARLAPLWVPVVLLSAAYMNSGDGLVALNLTGLFSFLPGQWAIPAGGWSIGIEVLCYVLFVGLTRVSTRPLIVATVAAVALRGWWLGNPLATPSQASWVHDTTLPAFLCFFLAGMVCARTVRLSTWGGWRARVSTVLGDASYGIYLLHPLVTVVFGPWMLLVTPALALAIHRLYEVPVGRRLRRLPRRTVGEDLRVQVGRRTEVVG